MFTHRNSAFDIDRTFDEIERNVVDLSPHPETVADVASLALNVTEDDRHFIVETRIPGVSEDDIELSVQDNTLTISAEKQGDRENRDRNWYIREWHYGRVARSVRLPADVDTDRADARLDKGILTVKLPKSKPNPIQKIAVKARKLLNSA